MKKKIIIAIFALMFFLPEILWSPLTVALFNFFKANYYWRTTNFLSFSNEAMSLVFTVQAIGVIGLSGLLFIFSKSQSNYKKASFIVSGIFFSLIFILSLFVLWLSFAFRNIGF
ncbi:MAG: hypothetical protein HY983_01170 [Candidatus Magasanikbacteria bacterium]|nr:hypothetical protein [Candidatus Magasanikbacteria bacterium]